MRGLIAASLLKQLQPAAKPYEVRDTRLKGFLLRVQPSGVQTYYVEFARGRRVQLGRADAVAPAQARHQAKAVLADAYTGKDPTATRREAKAHTLASFVEEVYRPWAEANIRTAAATVARLKSDFPDLQRKRLGEITPWLVEKWRTGKLKNGARATTVNRSLDDLRSVLGKAVAWRHLEQHPLKDVKRSRVDDNAKVRFLEQDEEQRLRAALDAREKRLRRERATANAWRLARRYPLLASLRTTAFADRLKPLVILSMNTGLRRGELFGLRWTDVDLERSMLVVRGETAKSKRTRHVPLNQEALAVVRGWREQCPDKEPLVFPGRFGGRLSNTRRAWMAVLNEARVANFRWHDLRHHFASRLVMAGVDLNTVRELLGHASYTMTLRYAHLAPEHKAAAVARLMP